MGIQPDLILEVVATCTREASLWQIQGRVNGNGVHIFQIVAQL
ncbi:hypothetical protein [Moorena producens]